ncbi:hypothetical protein PDJAM_G00006620 [Pangasius djambal]|uniref:Uncharacterized protein n=1 Tax=Pangasius djambal TaxID=1691987 RepID=A0ACC5XZB5_9TELE|nr:hypothetical protein [Pangasius djambal]
MPCHPDEDDLNTQGMDGGMEKQKEAEKDKESDAVDGIGGRHADALVSHQKAADNPKYHTVGHQKRKPKLRQVATLGKGSPNTKSRGAPIQVLFSQGSPEKTPMQEERGSVGGGQSQAEVLKQTLQTFSLPDKLNWWGEGDKADVLENSWTDIVHSHESMPRIQRHQQEALWELLDTEFIYINKLTIITDVTPYQLFSNIPSILDAHRRFWQEVMYPMLQNFAERFSAYLDYCWEEERNLEFTRRQLEINPHFNIFLMWVETHPQCGRMRLGDMQAKPHQRITKYPLLLKAILKATQDQYTQQTLNRMINSVSQFLDSINDYLLFKDDELALFALSQKIEGYELQGMSEEINKHMQKFCHFDLTSPIRGTGPKVIRRLIMGETLKVRGRKDSKLEVVVLLFTDVLLLTKTQKKSEKQKVVRPPLSLERIHCAELKDGYSFVLVEVSDLGCPVSVYSVSTPSPESCAAWISNIRQAQEALQSLRKKETIKPEEPSDQILEEPDPFPPASILNIKNTEEQSEYKSHIASLRFTAIEREDQNLHNQHGSRRMSAGEESSTSFPNRNSNSVSESDERNNICRPSNTSSKTQDHLVLKMGSVKQNRGVFWHVPAERLSESESELPEETPNQNSQKIPKMKTQRSESLPELPFSPLQGLLNRAKERERERGIAKTEGKHLEKTSLQSSNTVCAAPSPSPSEGEKEAAAEEREPVRSRWYDSHTGTETTVESSDNDSKNRPVTPLGVNVDWPGWCFDDEDVLEFTELDDETGDWIEQTLTTADLWKTPRHSDADYSEV